MAYSDALITAGVTTSVGTVGDSYDNALAETVNGLCKAELIHAQRLHEALGCRTPAEVEAAYTHDQDSAPAAS